MYTVGIDLGTTGCKAVVADCYGKIAGQEYIEYPLVISGDCIEQDAALWWGLSCKAVAAAAANSGISKDEIKAVSVSSQGISFVPVDNGLEPLCGAISWLDTRAKKEREKIKARFGEKEIFYITGKRVSEGYVLPKLIWLKANKKSVYNKTHKILMAHDYLIAKMTGECVTDNTMAAGTMMFDVTERRWSEKITGAFDISPDILPEVRQSGSTAGGLNREAARKMGLNENIAVAVGGQDQKVAAYFARGGGNAATLSLGTAGAMEFVVSKPVFDKKMRLPLFPFIDRDKWTLEPVISTAGAALKWYRDAFFAGADYKTLDEDAAKAKPGSGGVCFYPHFGMASSPHWLPGQKGAFYGLTLETSCEDVTRSVLEGIAFQIKENLGACEALGEKTDSITVFGSGSRSGIWLRIIADITGKNIKALASPDAAAQGAAKLAFETLGAQYGDNHDGTADYAPCEKNRELYKKIYKDYKTTENKLLK